MKVMNHLFFTPCCIKKTHLIDCKYVMDDTIYLRS